MENRHSSLTDIVRGITPVDTFSYMNALHRRRGLAWYEDDGRRILDPEDEALMTKGFETFETNRKLTGAALALNSNTLIMAQDFTIPTEINRRQAENFLYRRAETIDRMVKLIVDIRGDEKDQVKELLNGLSLPSPTND